jgi:hypothetical protein
VCGVVSVVEVVWCGVRESTNGSCGMPTAGGPLRKTKKKKKRQSSTVDGRRRRRKWLSMYCTNMFLSNLSRVPPAAQPSRTAMHSLSTGMAWCPQGRLSSLGDGVVPTGPAVFSGMWIHGMMLIGYTSKSLTYKTLKLYSQKGHLGKLRSVRIFNTP